MKTDNTEGDTETAGDADTDADSDTGMDTDTDTDNDTDSASEIETEIESDTHLGTDTDSASSSEEMSTDTASSVEDWSVCENAAPYEGEVTWDNSVEITDDTVFCNWVGHEGTLEEALAFKAKLRIVPGSYPFPIEDGDYPISLPICIIFPDEPGIASESVGSVHLMSQSDGPWGTYYGYTINQSTTDGRYLRTYVTLMGDQEAPTPPLVISNNTYVSISLCETEACDDPGDNHFSHCRPFLDKTLRDTATFEGGRVTLTLEVGEPDIALERYAFTHVEGELDGTPFEQSDYWHLFYRPGNHHFTRSYAFFFDQPIGDACGLKIGTWGYDPLLVYTVDCNLTEQEERAVIDNQSEVIRL